ncbi:MAG: phosphatidate cytidylyltransferase [Planctomycetota bacterium]
MDPLFEQYALILVGCLVAGGLAVVVLTRAENPVAASIQKTYFSWLIMIPIAFAVLLAGRLPTVAGFTMLSIAGFYEFARVTEVATNRWQTWSVLLLICVTFGCIALPQPDQPGWMGLFQAMPAWAAGILLAIPVLQDRASGELRKVALSIVGFLYIGWMFAHIGWLANSEYAAGYLLYFLFAVGVTDVSAFTFGSVFGRRALRPNISPNKTVEGAIGAFLVAMVLPWLLRFSFPESVGPLQLILFGLIVGIGGQLGDLAISMVKRDRNVKDMGDAIPGHGGVLDRIDSLIFTSPVLFHTLKFFDCL